MNVVNTIHTSSTRRTKRVVQVGQGKGTGVRENVVVTGKRIRGDEVGSMGHGMFEAKRTSQTKKDVLLIVGTKN